MTDHLPPMQPHPDSHADTARAILDDLDAGDLTEGDRRIALAQVHATLAVAGHLGHALIPQTYPLWCAEVIGDDVHVGRVIAWKPAPENVHGFDLLPITAEVGTSPGTSVVTADYTAVLFFGDTEADALAAARRPRT